MRDRAVELRRARISLAKSSRLAGLATPGPSRGSRGAGSARGEREKKCIRAPSPARDTPEASAADEPRRRKRNAPAARDEERRRQLPGPEKRGRARARAIARRT